MRFKFTFPPEKVSDLGGVLRLLQEWFKTVHIKAEVTLNHGAISESDFENSVQEAFKQMKVKLSANKEDWFPIGIVLWEVLL